MSKILHIDTDLQFPNRIHKSDINEVSQITDKAQNIAFAQSDPTKQPTYNYDGYFNFDGIDDFLQAPNADVFSGYQWRITIKLRMDSNDTAAIFTTRTNPLGVGSVGVVCYNNALIAQISINGSQYSIQIRSRVDLLVGEDILVILEKKGNVVKVYSPEIKDYIYTGGNMYYISDTLVSDIIEYDPTAKMGVFGGDVYLPDYTLQGRLYFMHITDAPILFDLPYSIGDTVPTNLSDKPFRYLKRYKDNGFKFYLSSRFLKDVNANASDQITSIKEEIEEIESRQVTNGLKFTRGNLDINRSRNQFLLNAPYIDIINSWSVGYWHNYYEAYYAQPFPFWGNLICSLRYLGGKYVMAYSGAGQSEQIGTYVMDADKWYHLCWLFDGTTLYMLVDGVLRDIFTPTFTTADINSVDIGIKRDDYYIDDMFLYDGLIVDPTGKTIGKKVFEPPRRGGFDDNFETKPLISINDL